MTGQEGHLEEARFTWRLQDEKMLLAGRHRKKKPYMLGDRHGKEPCRPGKFI